MGLVLLTGLVSLSVGQEPPIIGRGPANASSVEAFQALWSPGARPATEPRREVMDVSNSPVGVQPAGEAASATARAPVSSIGLQLSSEHDQRLSTSRLIEEAEALIRRYPWPTVLLGMGVGFLLARRVR